ncbi:MAG: hypothetical protein K1W34_05520 [Lachnospiraceae bacterium]
MDSLFVLRERFQELYSKNSRIIDKAVQFAVALAAFYLINKNVGFMKLASSPAVILALAVICTFFPTVMTIIAASVLILVHMYAVSLAALGVTAGIFLVMYIFYFRLTPRMALIVLLTPIAFALKIPCVIPIAYALVMPMAAIAAVGCGGIVYYMMEYIKKAAAGMKGSDAAGLMGQVSAYIKTVFQNKEMWVMIAACIICYLVVYTVRRQSVNHAWKIAVVAGAIVNIVVVTAGDMYFGLNSQFTSLIVGGAAGIVVGLIMELFLFAVDYSRTERFEYEDDEYHYYVKAIPKLSVSSPEKTVKRINGHRETEIIDAAEVRRKSKKQGKKPENRSPVREGAPGRGRDMEEVDKMLLTQSLKQDLNLK